MSRSTYQECLKCGEEIEFEIEWISADDGQWWQAGMIATELQSDCKCSFTESEIESLEEKAANDYAENYEPDY